MLAEHLYALAKHVNHSAEHLYALAKHVNHSAEHLYALAEHLYAHDLTKTRDLIQTS
jgi:hypothetical protein